MAEYIGCRKCDSTDCKGCNLKNLETMLNNGKFDCLMNGNRCINTAADVAPVRHGRWVDRIVDENEVIQPWMQRYYCSECLEGGNQSWFKFCPNCGAKMDGCDGNSDMA